MKIGSRMPPFAGKIGFDAFADWLADNDFEAIDTPTLTKKMASKCEKLGLEIGSSVMPVLQVCLVAMLLRDEQHLIS